MDEVYTLVGNLLYQVTFFLTFDDSILILCSSYITCDSSFLTFGSSFTFISHLMVPSLHYAVPTSYVIVLFSHYAVSLLFFLTFDGSILTLCGFKKIYTADSFSLYYTVSLFFSLHVFLSISSIALPPPQSDRRQQKQKPQMVQYLLMVMSLNKSGVRIIKEPRLPKSSWSWMEIASTSQRKSGCGFNKWCNTC